MATPELYVLAVAPGSRTAEANELFDSLGVYPKYRVLVTTQPDPVSAADFDGHLVLFDSDELNIGKWWNRGLDYIAGLAGSEPYDVLVAETDARMYPQDVEVLRHQMRDFGAVMVGGDWEHTLEDHVPWYFRTNNDFAPVGRIPGIMKVVAGETGIRHDPEYRWWLADDDYEWEHRIQGGTLLVAGIGVRHEGTQGPLTGDRLRFWEEDQVKFQEKWGGLPATNGVMKP